MLELSLKACMLYTVTEKQQTNKGGMRHESKHQNARN